MSKNYDRLFATLSETVELEDDHLLIIREAGNLLDSADAIDAAIRLRAAGPLVGPDGDKLHPGVTEARHLRVQAVAMIRHVQPDDAPAGAAPGKNAVKQKAANAKWNQVRADQAQAEEFRALLSATDGL